MDKTNIQKAEEIINKYKTRDEIADHFKKEERFYTGRLIMFSISLGASLLYTIQNIALSTINGFVAGSTVMIVTSLLYIGNTIEQRIQTNKINSTVNKMLDEMDKKNNKSKIQVLTKDMNDLKAGKRDKIPYRYIPANEQKTTDVNPKCSCTIKRIKKI